MSIYSISDSRDFSTPWYEELFSKRESDGSIPIRFFNFFTVRSRLSLIPVKYDRILKKDFIVIIVKVDYFPLIFLKSVFVLIGEVSLSIQFLLSVYLLFY